MKTPFLLSSLMLCLLMAVAQTIHGEDGAKSKSTPAKKIKVFLLAGQSNMEGKGDGDQLTAEERTELASTQQRLRFAYNHQPITPLQVTAASEGIKRKFGVAHTFGPELFFGLRLAAAWPQDRFLFIKRSQGGTS